MSEFRTASATSVVAAVLLAVVVAILYGTTLGHPFHAEDLHVVANNPSVRRLANVPRFFVDVDTSSTSQPHRGLRPLLLITFWLNYALAGTAPWSYHLVNVFLHWLAVVLVYRVVRDHLWLGDAGRPVAMVAALLMAVHPLATSAVNLVAARLALLVTVLYLATFDAAVRRRRNTAIALLTAALLVSGIAATLPFVMLGYWALDRTRARAVPGRFVAALGVVAAAGLAYRALLMPSWLLAAVHGPGAAPLPHLMSGWSAYLYYARLFLWPNALVIDRLDYPVVRSLVEPRAWVSLLALTGLGILAWTARRRWPALTLAALWYAITLLPQAALFPLAETVSERRLYLALPMLGMATAIAMWTAARAVATRVHAAPVWPLAVGATFLVTALGAATVGRNQTWADDYTLWLDATRKAPRNPRAWSSAAGAALDRGDRTASRALLAESLALAPCHPEALMTQSTLEWQEGDLDASLEAAERALRCRPGLAETHYTQGAALERLGRSEDALRAYRRTTALDAHHTNAWIGQGRLLEQRGDWIGAAGAYDAALGIDPGRADAAMAAALIYHHRLADSRRALERYERVLAAVPSHYGARYQRVVALLDVGNERAAVKAWRAFVPLAEAAGDQSTLDSAPEILRRRVRSVREPRAPAT